jgi:hypothetical protein
MELLIVEANFLCPAVELEGSKKSYQRGSNGRTNLADQTSHFQEEATERE